MYTTNGVRNPTFECLIIIHVQLIVTSIELHPFKLIITYVLRFTDMDCDIVDNQRSHGTKFARFWSFDLKPNRYVTL